MSDSIKPFFRAFGVHSNTHYSRPITKEEKEHIRNHPNKRIRRLDSLARLIIKEQRDNCAAVALINNKWYFTANDYAQISENVDAIFKALLMIEINENGEVLITETARGYLLKNYLKSVDKKHVNIRSRLEIDIGKFLSSLQTNDIFTKEEINNLLDPKCEYSYCENHLKLHAEARLLFAIARRNKKLKNKTATLGISKLCCKLCAAAMHAIDKNVNCEVLFRGRHGNFYFKWRPPSFLLKGDYFKSFVGKKAFECYSNSEEEDKREIERTLKDLQGHRTSLEKWKKNGKKIFQAGRGASQALKSESPAAPDTEDETSSSDDYPEDSSSSAET